jgi:hypothetical protein
MSSGDRLIGAELQEGESRDKSSEAKNKSMSVNVEEVRSAAGSVPPAAPHVRTSLRQGLKRKGHPATPSYPAYDRDPKSPYLYVTGGARRRNVAPLPEPSDNRSSKLTLQPVKLEPADPETESLVVAGLALGTAFSLATTVVFPSAEHTLDGLATVKQEPTEDWTEEEEIITPDVGGAFYDPLAEDPLATAAGRPSPIKKPFSWPPIDPLFLTQIEFRLPKDFAPFLRALAKPTAEILPLVQETAGSNCRLPAELLARSSGLSVTKVGPYSSSPTKVASEIKETNAEAARSQLRRLTRQAKREQTPTFADSAPLFAKPPATSLGEVPGVAGHPVTSRNMFSMINQMPVFSSGEVSILRLSAAGQGGEEQRVAPSAAPSSHFSPPLSHHAPSTKSASVSQLTHSSPSPQGLSHPIQAANLLSPSSAAVTLPLRRGSRPVGRPRNKPKISNIPAQTESTSSQPTTSGELPSMGKNNKQPSRREGGRISAVGRGGANTWRKNISPQLTNCAAGEIGNDPRQTDVALTGRVSGESEAACDFSGVTAALKVEGLSINR